MTALLRWSTAGWALLSLIVMAFVDVPLLRWLIVVPVLVFGPGLVAARFVSPDNGRFRATIAVLAGLVALVLVSEAFVIGHAFDVMSIAAVIAAMTVIGAMAVPYPTAVVATLPARPSVDPRSEAARRFRVGVPDRRIEIRSDPSAADVPGDAATTAAASEAEFVVTSPTLGELQDSRR